MPFIVAPFTWLAGAIASKGIVTFVLAPLASIAISAVANKLFAPKLPKNSLASGSPLTVNRDPVASRRVIYGTTRVGGTLVFAHVTGTKNELLHLVITLAGHEVDEITEQFWFNDEPVIVPYPGNNSNHPTLGTHLLLNKHRGEDGQTVDTVLNGHDSALWTANHRLRGIAYIYARLVWDQDKWPGGIPVITALVRGRKCYDPRTATTVFTSNPALCIRDYLTNTVFGLGVPSADLDDASFIAAANICDESVVTNGYTRTGDVTISDRTIPVDSTLGIAPEMLITGTGIPANCYVVSIESETSLRISQDPTATNSAVTLSFGAQEPRYSLNGTFDTDAEPASVLEHMISTMAGSLLYIDGKWVCHAGAHRTPTITIDEDDLRGPIQVQTKDSMRDSFNRVKGTFANPAEKFQATDFTAVTNATYLTEDGSVERWRDVSLAFVTSHAQAQRLAKIELERNRQDITATLPCNLSALRVRAGDTILVNNTRLGWVSKVFTVVNHSFAVENDGTVGCDLAVRETASTVWSWANGEETLYDPAPNTTLPDPWTAAAPTSLALASGTSHLLASSDGTITSRILATWTAPADEFVQSGGRIEVEYKKSADSDWSNLPAVPGNTTRQYISPVQDGINYDVRVRAINSLGVRSAYATVTAHTVVGKTAAPGTPSSFTATGVVEGIALKWTNTTDADLSEVEVWQSSTSTFGDGASIGTIDGTAILVSFAGGAVTRYFWVRSVDTSGNTSSWVGPQSATALEPSGGTQGPAGDPGDDGITGIITHNNTLTWSRAIDAGAWSPNTSNTTLTVEFKQGTTSLASRTLVVTFSSGNLSATGGTTSGITATVAGSGGPAMTVIFTYDATGATAWVSLQTVQGGNTGSTGPTGAAGTDGNVTNWIFRRAASQPSTPTGDNVPTDWSSTPPAPDGNPLWASKATQTPAGVTVGSWSTPIRLDGARWFSGAGAPSGSLGVQGDFYLNETNGDIYEKTGASTWTLRDNLTGPTGSTGSTGDRAVIIYIRQASVPTTPTGDNPAGWSESAPAGSDPLWLSTGRKTTGGTLVGAWSTPVRYPSTATFFADKDGISSSILITGDVVFDSTEDNRLYRWNGSSWEDTQKILRMLDLPDLGFGNLIGNPGFIQGDYEWIKETGWTIESDATNAFVGSFVAKHVADASTRSLRSSKLFAAKMGDKIYLSAQVKKDGSYAATSQSLRVFEWAANKTSLLATQTLAISPTTSYAAYSGIVTVGNAATAFVTFTVTIGAQTAGTLYVGFMEARTAITAGLVGANEIIANTANIADAIITSAKIVSLDVSKLNAGTITSKDIALAGAGAAIRASTATAYGTGVGWWLGNDGGTFKFRIGDPAGKSLKWDGTDLLVNAVLDVGTGTTRTRIDGTELTFGYGASGKVSVVYDGSLSHPVVNVWSGATLGAQLGIGSGGGFCYVAGGTIGAASLQSEAFATKPGLVLHTDTYLYREAAGVVRTDTFRALAVQDNSGNQVVGAQQAAIASFSVPVFTATGNYATDSSPLTTAVNNNATKINSILTALRTHGLIAT